MSYFKLSLLNKVFNVDSNVNDRYIKNTISEFYSNNIPETLLKYERVNNPIQKINNCSTVYTKTYTYNEKLQLHQNGQAEFTFSLDKMLLDNDYWKENPFAEKIKIGTQLLLEDSFNNMYLFSVKNVSYVISENNIVYNYTCQDSFSYFLSKQNDGYSINNDIQSVDFIGALNINSWAEKIVKECKISYKYLSLEKPLFLYTDLSAGMLSGEKEILKRIKPSYLNNNENSDLYETFPFSCSSTTANNALISLGEELGLTIKTATVLLNPTESSYVELETYFWYEPAKNEVSGLYYSPFRDIQNFTFSQSGESLVTVLNVESRTLSSDEVVTAIPEVSPFFIKLFNSEYWNNYTVHYNGMYMDLLKGTYLTMRNEEPDDEIEIPEDKIYNTTKDEDPCKVINFSRNHIKCTVVGEGETVEIDEDIPANEIIIYERLEGDEIERYCIDIETDTDKIYFIGRRKIWIGISYEEYSWTGFTISNIIIPAGDGCFAFTKQISDIEKAHYQLYPYQVFSEGQNISYIIFHHQGEIQENRIDTTNSTFRYSIDYNKNEITITVFNSEIRFVDEIVDKEIFVFFKNDYNDDDENFARIADQLPWLENKIIDFTYFYNIESITQNQKKDINERLYNILRKKNSEVLINASTYYNLIHSQTKYLAEMTNNIDNVGAEVSNIEYTYLRTGSLNDYNISGLLQRWNLLETDLIGAQTNAISSRFVDLYENVSDYMRKYLNDRQRCLKNLYNFRQYFESPVDEKYKTAYQITITMKELEDNATNIYNFDATHADSYDSVNLTNINNSNLQKFFIIGKDDEGNDCIVDYNNIQLYLKDNNHTPFDKNNYLLTLTNFDEMTLHCYVDQYRQNTEYDTYNSGETYYRQVCFISTEVLTLSIDDIEKVDAMFEKDGQSETVPCHLEYYNKNKNYFICWKLYEDEYKWGDLNKIIITKTDSSSVEIEKRNIIFIDQSTSENRDRGVIDFSKWENQNLFYQEISSQDILKNYLYRKFLSDNSSVLWKKDYVVKTLGDLLGTIDVYNENEELKYKTKESFISEVLEDTPLWNLIGDDYTPYKVTQAKDYLRPYSPTAYKYYGWWFLDNSDMNVRGYLYQDEKSLLQSFFKPLPSFFLIYGGYESVPAVITDNTDKYYGLRAPYRSIEEKQNSLWIKNNPISAYYDGDGSDDSNEYDIVNINNYQNYYVKTKGGLYTLASNGITRDLTGQLLLVEEDSESAIMEFIFDFPSYNFYASKGEDNNIAYTLGNLVWNKSDYNSYKYRVTKNYTRINPSQISNYKKNSFLIVDPATLPDDRQNIDLDQYIDYAAISSGKQYSYYQLNSEIYREKNIYVITSGQINEFENPNELGNLEDPISYQDFIRKFFESTLVDTEGVEFTIEEQMKQDGIVKNLYTLTKKVSVSIDTLQNDGTNYILKDHLQNNFFTLYNEKDEQVYTINQVIDHLCYKLPQTFIYHVFNTQTPYYIRLYRSNYNNTSPDIISYELDLSDLPLPEAPGDIINYENQSGYFPYEDFKYDVEIKKLDMGSYKTNGEFWYKVTSSSNPIDPLLERCAIIESDLQMYWEEAHSSSLLCDIFVPSDWRVKIDDITNNFDVMIIDQSGTPTLNNLYIPQIAKYVDNKYAIYWNDKVPSAENSDFYSYEQISQYQKNEVDDMLDRVSNVGKNQLYFSKIAENISFYNIITGGMKWSDFIFMSTKIPLLNFTGWNGIAINYLTSHFIDNGKSKYEELLDQRDLIWRDFYKDYPYLFLESSYTSDSATTSADILYMAQCAFKDLQYPERSYSISLIDLIQNIETQDEDMKYNPQYHRNPELHIGDGIMLSVGDFIKNKDDIYEALSQVLFISDITRDLREDGNCQITVNSIKYQDKLIHRLAKLIKRNVR